MRSARWDRCVNHRGSEAMAFLRDFFREKERCVLVVGGAGFDPRSTYVTGCLVEVAGRERVRGFFYREERPRPAPELVRRAEANAAVLQRALARCEIAPIDIFAPADGAVVGGRRAVREVSRVDFKGVTDIVVDLSALSVGVAFPLVRYLVEQDLSANVHVLVTDETPTDLGIRSTPSDSADTIVGFKGGLGLSQHDAAAKLWLPQLVEERRVILDRIHTHVQPDDVCPILPFPADDPRRSDRLIAEYQEQLESVWEVDAHDIVYADEKNPLDLYRTILRIDEFRSAVFKETGGSLTILSPMGSKVLSIGALMASIERDFPVVHVESVSYSVDFERLDEARRGAPGELVHLWLRHETRAP